MVVFYCFRFRKSHKNDKFSVFLPVKEPLVATLSKTRALIFRIHVSGQGMTIPNLLKTLIKNTLVAMLRFCFRNKLSKMLNFDRFFL